MGKYGWGDSQTDTKTCRHINTMTRLGLGAGPSEKQTRQSLPNMWLNAWIEWKKHEKLGLKQKNA